MAPPRLAPECRPDAAKIPVPLWIYLLPAAVPRPNVGIGLAHRAACEGIRFPDRDPELRPLGIRFEPGALNVGLQICLEMVVCRHVVVLAALFMQAGPIRGVPG
jgi:hypothetical protein